MRCRVAFGPTDQAGDQAADAGVAGADRVDQRDRRRQRLPPALRREQRRAARAFGVEPPGLFVPGAQPRERLFRCDPRQQTGEVFVGELHVAQIDVVVEALFSCRAIGEMRLRIQGLACLREDVCRRVADDMQLVVSGAFVHMTVIVDDFHAFSLQID